ncbi:MAG: queuosine precursor transporter [Desulfotomaculaceae bacterium]|nr:queuosine precursor transporter [Desulfotomaculaceae bacterium]
MRYKLFPFVMVAFVVVLLVSNTVAVKVTQLGPFYFDGATVLFPLAYIFGDILTEVYGFKKSRFVIWSGFAACAFMASVYWLIGVIPAAPDWGNQGAYNAILGQTPRIVLASLVAYFCGEFVNSFIMAKMKILTLGRRLWTRTISSTVAGQAVDTSLFVVIAFAGVIPWAALLYMAVSNYIFKTSFEAAATPVTYAACGWLKRVEQEDYFDNETNFNPFAVSLEDLE